MTGENIKTLTGSPDYYNRYEESKNWDKVAVIAGRAMQSAEFNEIQDILEDKIKSLGNAIYDDGTIIEGCNALYDASTKTVSVEGGRVIIGGLCYDISAADLHVPEGENIQIGVKLKHECVDEYDDTSLLDPAKGFPQYKMPGAYRIITTAEWTLNSGDDDVSNFAPIYDFSDNEIISRDTEFTRNDYLDTAARYDRHAHGHYVVEGLKVTALSGSQAGVQTFSISEGEAHINGYEAVIPHSVRVVAQELPDLAEIESEVHRYTSTSGRMNIALNHTPVERVGHVRVTKARTVTITHGNYKDCVDDLPDTSVFEIVSVIQGETTFVSGTDFLFVADKLNWGLNGDEPAPYSSYQVTYHYRDNISPDSFDKSSITVSGLVEGSLVEIDYAYRMPRKDIIVMYRDGTAGIVRGVSHRNAPVRPSAPPEAICLAEISQNWDGLPAVTNIAPICVSAESINAMQKQIVELYSLTAILAGKIEAPAGAFNIFVDPLLDDSMRDKGTTQTAVISGGMLGLITEKGSIALTLQNDSVLDFTNEAVINNVYGTTHRQNNSQKAFGMNFGARVSLDPPIDRLTDDEGFLRQISVTAHAEGFNANEAVSVIFDGAKIQCSSANADSKGIFNGTFTIPEGIPAGVKLVQLKGTANEGSAYFYGIQEARNSINYNLMGREYAPYVQTFIMSESRIITGAAFYTHKSEGDLKVEIREAVSRLPTQAVIASCIAEHNQSVSKTWVSVNFDSPVLLLAGNEYAIVLYSEASLFHLDTSRRRYKFEGGQYLQSNSKTWTLKASDEALCFKLFGAKFTGSRKIIPLGNVNLSGVTDITPLAEVLRTGNDTDATFILTQGNSETARMQAWQKISFDTPLTGVYSVSAELFGDNIYSPILGRSPQLLAEKVASTCDYVSRAFNCGIGRRVLVSTEEYIPAGASIRVFIETGTNIWSEAESTESEILGEGWTRFKRYIPCDLAATRLKITLNGTTSARPFVRSISAVILNA